MSDFWLLSIAPIIMIIGGFLMEFAKQNELFGLRTSATLSDPEIWEKSNRIVGKITAILGILLLSLNLLAYLEGWLLQFIWLDIILILATLNGIAIFGIIYSNRLKREKEKSGKIMQFTISKQFVFLVSFIASLMVIFGILMLFISPNSFIGIRIGKTLSDPILWEKVNRISGIGFIAIGLLFTFIFFNITQKEGSQRTKLFERNFAAFIILTLIWSFISVGLAYLM